MWRYFFILTQVQFVTARLGAMKYPQLVYGMLGIFVYVGVEVYIDNNFGALLKTPGYLTEAAWMKAGSLNTFHFTGVPDDRPWTGAISVFNYPKQVK